jgi:hypothetical protein
MDGRAMEAGNSRRRCPSPEGEGAIVSYGDLPLNQTNVRDGDGCCRHVEPGLCIDGAHLRDCLRSLGLQVDMPYPAQSHAFIRMSHALSP